MIKSISDLDLKDKTVFIRVDFNIPIENGVIEDSTRIKTALKSIDYCISQGAKVVLGSHLGRPKGERNLKYSLKPVADYIKKENFFPIKFVEECIGDKVSKAISDMEAKTVLLLENLRFHKGEASNDPEFVKELSKPYDVYINDAFGTCHRKHASIYGMPGIIKEKGIGFLVEKEREYFDNLVKSPEHPFGAIIGGAKVSDKIGVIKSLLKLSDVILIGGAMAYTFLKYKGVSVGTSLVEDEQLKIVGDIFNIAVSSGVKIVLPVDHIISDKFGGKAVVCDNINIPKGYMGLDIGERSSQIYEEALLNCKTVLWNGPMGVFEQEEYSKGTFYIAEVLSKLDATVVVGGGDSVAAVNKANVVDKMSHISTGGGASLEYIEFGTLPGIDILKNI